VFKIWGVSYQNALNLVTAIFLVFLLTIYLVCKVKFGFRTAILTMVASSVSLLQLTWNSMVYTEGVFGIAVGIVVLVSMKAEKNLRYGIWAILGISCSLVYYVRPNGILLFAGLPAFMVLKKWQKREWILPLLAVTVAMICILPWFLRNFINFGNPFHIASNAGLLRGGMQDPLNLTFAEFIKRNGLLFPFLALFKGSVNFFRDLNFFEHGLHIIPIAGLITGALRRVSFYSKFAVAGFLLSFLFVCYVSYNYSWAGIRYFAPFLPFVYGYGIYNLLLLFDSILKRFKYYKTAAAGFSILLLIIPVYYPHRYYEREIPRKRVENREYQKKHAEILKQMLGKDSCYLASSAMAGMAYQSPFRCISIHEYFDTSYVKSVFEKFNPGALILTTEDTSCVYIKQIVETIEKSGNKIDLVDTLRNYLYYRILSP
ncbi:MAG: glycosyltransferase family 39 protein, partial [Fibrobacter sp.]|nr:glycosyltransferase family 39 protein [Fibrobacter sp.]